MRGWLIPGTVLIALAALLAWAETDRRRVVGELASARAELRQAQQQAQKTAAVLGALRQNCEAEARRQAENCEAEARQQADDAQRRHEESLNAAEVAFGVLLRGLAQSLRNVHAHWQAAADEYRRCVLKSPFGGGHVGGCLVDYGTTMKALRREINSLVTRLDAEGRRR